MAKFDTRILGSEDPQYAMFRFVMAKLGEIGALKQVILIGSWCKYYYADLFKDPHALSPNKTTDIDFLVDLPLHLKQKIDIPASLSPFGFEIDFNDSGYMKLHHPDIHIDFMVPEKGKGFDKPVLISQLGVKATPLRYLSLLAEDRITVEKEDVTVNLPNPANFGVHKLILSTRREKKTKAVKDFLNGCEILTAIINRDGSAGINGLLSRIPEAWRKTALKSFEIGLDKIRNSPEAPRVFEFEHLFDAIKKIDNNLRSPEIRKSEINALDDGLELDR